MKDFDIGFFIGLLLSAFLGIMFIFAMGSSWEHNIVLHNAGQYNPTNGHFEWKTNCPCVVTNK